MRRSMARPTTWREHKASITAKYSQPSLVHRQVLSVPHTWFSSSVLKCRFNRLSAMGKEALLLVFA